MGGVAQECFRLEGRDDSLKFLISSVVDFDV